MRHIATILPKSVQYAMNALTRDKYLDLSLTCCISVPCSVWCLTRHQKPCQMMVDIGALRLPIPTLPIRKFSASVASLYQSVVSASPQSGYQSSHCIVCLQVAILSTSLQSGLRVAILSTSRKPVWQRVAILSTSRQSAWERVTTFFTKYYVWQRVAILQLSMSRYHVYESLVVQRQRVPSLGYESQSPCARILVWCGMDPLDVGLDSWQSYYEVLNNTTSWTQKLTSQDYA